MVDMGDMPDSLSERDAFYYTYQPKCLQGVKPYSDIDIIRSELLISKDAGLAERVAGLVKEFYEDSTSKIVKRFYAQNRNKLDDEKGAKIDLSTLVIAAIKKGIIDTAHAVVFLAEDQMHHTRQERRKYLLLAPIINWLMRKSDQKKANKKTGYELMQHVITRKNIMPQPKEETEENIYDPLKEFYASLEEPEN